MRDFYKIIIVGGGASGLICATLLAEKLGGNNVLVLEKNDRVGKKLSQTGNGQGNLTNAELGEEHFHSGVKSFPRAALNAFDGGAAEAFYNSIGIFLCGDGKRYPAGKQASAVTDALRLRLEVLGVTVLTCAEVISASRADGAFTVRTASAGFKSSYLVLAFGGKAAKQYGTNGASYALAESFEHTVTELYPSLVQLKTELKSIRGLKGIKTEAVVTAYGDGVTFSRGDVLFTEYGVSGSAVFAVSGAVTKGGRLEIEFLPDFTVEEIERMIAARVKLGYSGAEVTGGLIHKQLGRAVFALSDGTIENIAAVMKRFPLKVTGTLGFDYAQVTKGGVDVNEIDPETMMSKKNNNLYIIGEALDVDGDCGGYNLQWAFSSAATAAKSIYEDR